MAKLARLPKIRRAPEAADGAPAHRVPRLRTRYYAFLSYSHKDRDLADWLHRELERFRVPGALAGKLTANGVVPRRLSPIFRDQHDLSAGEDLAVEIEAALAASQFLVVLCSPTAAKSRWTNLEIESFKRTRPEGCVLAAVVAGEPFASDIKGREAEECFPPALRFKYDRRGHRTAKRAEPLAADFRDSGEGKRLAFLKLVAGMLGVGLDELVQRATTRKHRQLAYVAAASLGGMAITSTLAVTAIQARDAAREQRRQAEGLVAFMVGDLKDKLEPIGRLDALDGVGARVLAYYSKQDTSDLSDAALMQRSKALSLMAEVANLRGDIDGSLRLYREAMVGTGEAVRRNPNDPQRLWEHAQNVFYVGEIAVLQQNYRAAEGAMREYQRLANRMVAIAPDNMKWRMEVQYADFNLGVVLKDQRRFPEATRQFDEAFRTIQAISTADPSNTEYRESIAESLAWLADSLEAQGRFPEAVAARQRDISTLDNLISKTHDNHYQQRLIHAVSKLGDLYIEQGQSAPAIQQFRTAADDADQLTKVEPRNTQWLQEGMEAHFKLANALLAIGDTADAIQHVQSGCATASRLVQRPPPLLPSWKWGSIQCSILQARLALAAGNKAQAAQIGRQLVAQAKAFHSGDAGTDAIVLARAYRHSGDFEKASGDAPAATAAWSTAANVFPQGIAETPEEMLQHIMILQRVGRKAEAQSLADKLRAMGFRDPEFTSIS